MTTGATNTSVIHHGIAAHHGCEGSGWLHSRTSPSLATGTKGSPWDLGQASACQDVTATHYGSKLARVAAIGALAGANATILSNYAVRSHLSRQLLPGHSLAHGSLCDGAEGRARKADWPCGHLWVATGDSDLASGHCLIVLLFVEILKAALKQF